jgi:hypothetical protein
MARRATRSFPRVTLNKDGTVVVRGILARDWSSLATKISLDCYRSEDEWKKEKIEKQKRAAGEMADMASVIRGNIEINEAWHREMRRISDILTTEFDCARRDR